MARVGTGRSHSTWVEYHAVDESRPREPWEAAWTLCNRLRRHAVAPDRFATWDPAAGTRATKCKRCLVAVLAFPAFLSDMATIAERGV